VPPPELQPTVNDVCVLVETEKLVGVGGGGTGLVVPVVVTGLERSPPLSDAQSAIAYVVLAERPVSTKEVEVVAM
jgi:hypothetical protein